MPTMSAITPINCHFHVHSNTLLTTVAIERFQESAEEKIIHINFVLMKRNE